MTTDNVITPATLEMPIRVKTAVAFLTSAVALLCVTIFAVTDGLRPFLEGIDPNSAEAKALLADLFPFEGVTEVRMIYGAFILMPIILPLLFRGKIAAWTTLILGALLTAVNIEDAVGTFILADRLVFGLAFLISVGVPALIGIVSAFAWSRS